LLHGPRGHAAVHDLVPRADDAARTGQPGGRPARVPRAAARGVPRCARPARARSAAGLRAAGAWERGLLGQLVHGHARGTGSGMSRMTVGEARRLWLEASDEELVGRAQEMRARWHAPNRATYMVMRIVNYTNVCVAQCDYCAFYVLPNQSGGYVL